MVLPDFFVSFGTCFKKLPNYILFRLETCYTFSTVINLSLKDQSKDRLIPLKLASFKADQRPYRSSAANNVGAAVSAHVGRSGRLDAAHR